MVQAHKRGLIFLAEYGVIFQGTLFILSCFQSGVFSVWFFSFWVAITLFALVLASLIKRVLKKKRPEKRKELFMPFGEYTFPSGHATGMTVITLCIFTVGSMPLSVLSLLVSACVMSARVDARVHDWIDMVGGIVLGSFVFYSASTLIL